MKARKLQIALSMLVCSAIVRADLDDYFKTLEEIKAWVISDLGTIESPIDEKKIVIEHLDINGDGKKDYWLLYPALYCGSQGCYGYPFLSTEKGYCLADDKVMEHELRKHSTAKPKCSPYSAAELRNR